MLDDIKQRILEILKNYKAKRYINIYDSRKHQLYINYYYYNNREVKKITFQVYRYNKEYTEKSFTFDIESYELRIYFYHHNQNDSAIRFSDKDISKSYLKLITKYLNFFENHILRNKLLNC